MSGRNDGDICIEQPETKDKMAKSSFIGEKVKVLGHSVVSQLVATSWTVACQAPLSMGLSR